MSIPRRYSINQAIIEVLAREGVSRDGSEAGCTAVADAIEKSLKDKANIHEGNIAYFRDYHYITQTRIGMAKMSLMMNKPDEALLNLQTCSDELDTATEKHLPEYWAALKELGQ